MAAMNLAELQKKLIGAARKSPPSAEVPYAFEKRIMARLSATPRPDEWALWTRALWYGAAACTAVALFMSAWSITSASDSDLASNFSQDLEQTILESANDEDSAW